MNGSGKHSSLFLYAHSYDRKFFIVQAPRVKLSTNSAKNAMRNRTRKRTFKWRAVSVCRCSEASEIAWKVRYRRTPNQGSPTEGEGLVRLTS